MVPPDEQLTEAEARYVTAARAANTLRGYRSDWTEWCAWATSEDVEPLPAPPAAISRYLTALAQYGAAVGTMSRRLSSIRFAHRVRNLADPTADARVVTVWEGIRRTHATPPSQATPLMPPELGAVIEACPTTRTWPTSDRPDEPDLAGYRDRALLTVGFFAALRRSELAALRWSDLTEHDNGLVVALPRSKTNQTGDQAELVVLPHTRDPLYDPITHLQAWARTAELDTTDPEARIFRSVNRHNQPGERLSPTAINTTVQRALTCAGIDPDGYSAHSLRAGFVTYAHLHGATDRAIAHQTRHRALATIGTYVRIHDTWTDNAATQLGL